MGRLSVAAAFRNDPRKAVFPMIPPRAVRAGGGSKVKVLGRKRYSQSPGNRQFAGQLGLPIPSTARPILPENPKEDPPPENRGVRSAGLFPNIFLQIRFCRWSRPLLPVATIISNTMENSFR